MAGKIIADTIETGAGADISTSYVVNGSAKAWFTFNYTATLDSLNISSVTDAGSGNCFGNFSSSMSNNDYAHPVMTGAYRTRYIGTGPTSTTIRTNNITTFNSSGSSVDDAMINCTVHGDLA